MKIKLLILILLALKFQSLHRTLCCSMYLEYLPFKSTIKKKKILGTYIYVTCSSLGISFIIGT